MKLKIRYIFLIKILKQNDKKFGMSIHYIHTVGERMTNKVIMKTKTAAQAIMKNSEEKKKKLLLKKGGNLVRVGRLRRLRTNFTSEP